MKPIIQPFNNQYLITHNTVPFSLKKKNSKITDYHPKFLSLKKIYTQFRSQKEKKNAQLLGKPDDTKKKKY